MARQRILLTGAHGNLGQALAAQLEALSDDCNCHNELEVLAYSRQEFDICLTQDDLKTKLSELSPDVIINAAAYTNVDKTEEERSLAEHVNGDVPGWMGEWAVANNAYLLHFSTDYVFDGSKATAYTPEDIPNPLNGYGNSKLTGERLLLDSADEHSLILRVSWLFGNRPMGFVHFLQQSLAQNKPVKVVTDQIGTPTWTESVAALLPRLLAERPTGLCHATNQGEVSRYDQALFIYQAMGLSQAEAEDRIEAVLTADLFQTVKRPRYTAMVSSFETMPTWQDATQAFLAQHKHIDTMTTVAR